MGTGLIILDILNMTVFLADESSRTFSAVEGAEPLEAVPGHECPYFRKELCSGAGLAAIY